MKIRNKIILGYLVVAILVAVMEYVTSTISYRHIKESFGDLDKDVLPTVAVLNDMRTAVLQLVSSTSEYVLFAQGDGGAANELALSEEEEIYPARDLYTRSFRDYQKLMYTYLPEETVYVHAIRLAGDELLQRSAEIVELTKEHFPARIILGKRELFEQSEERFLKEIAKAIEIEDIEIRKVRTRLGSTIGQAEGTGILINLITILFAIIASTVIARTISRPLDKLRDTAFEIAEGRLETRVRVESRDEVGSLALSFNTMTEKLFSVQQAQEKTNRNLQHRAAELQAEIEGRKRAEEALRESGLRFSTVWEKATDGMRMTDEDGTIVLVNDVYCKMVEKPREEIEGEPMSIVFEEAKQAEALRKHRERFRSRSIPAHLEREIVLWNGKRVSLELSNTFLEIPHQPVLSLSVFRDVTERKHAEDALRTSEERFRSILDDIEDGYYYEVDTAGNFTFVNPALVRMLGRPANELMGMNYRLYMTPEGSKAVFKTYNRVFRTGIPERAFEWDLVRPDGTLRSVEVSVYLIKGADGSINGFRGTVHDITERKRAEERLHASERRYRELFENNPQPMLVYDLETLAFLSVNDAMIAHYGYSREEFLSMTIKDIRPGEDVPLLLDNIAQPERKLERAGEWRHKKKDGTIMNVEITSHSLPLWNGRPSRLVSVSDATERKRAEEALRESEKRYREVVENASDIIYSTDRNGRFTHANAAALRVVGYSLEELTKLSYLDLVLPDYRSAVKRTYVEQFRAKQPSSYVEFPFHTSSGEVRWFSQNASLVLEGQNAAGFHVIARDVTERKQVEEALRASLLEKEVLLKEIHHRVKNNMQLISSLLSLQSHSVTDERFLRLLKESQNRVKSMAMIHERLYRSNDFSSIDLTDYIRELVASLVRSYSVRGNIAVSVSGEPVSLSVETAVPCGLIINELISNALKYAFPNGGKGEIKVDLKTQEQNGFILDVSDNGVGIGSDIDPLTANSLGLRLVKILTNQIKGSMEIDRSSGTRFSFNIPV